MMKADGPFTVFKRTWNEFLQETSIAGLANSGKSRNGIVRRIFWQIAFIIMFSISFKQIIEVVKDYFDYPVITTVTVNNQEKVRETIISGYNVFIVSSIFWESITCKSYKLNIRSYF